MTAIYRYENGATGVFLASTGEASGSNHWEICGDRGRLSMSEGKLEFIELVQPASEFLRECKASFAMPDRTRILYETPKGGGHRAITENFVNAILDDEPLIAPGVEGLESIELTNAMILSGLKQTTVEIPMDRDGFEGFLEELVEKSRSRKAE